MPKLKAQLPKYRHHRASGQAIVTLDGRDFYLGPFGTSASKQGYDRLLTEWLANGRRLEAPSTPMTGITVVEVTDRYLDHAKGYYRKPDGTPTSEYDSMVQALRPLNQMYARMSAAEFGPRALKAVRQAMIELGWCRSYINQQVSRLKTVFRWAAENELIPAGTHHGLLAVRGLAKGRCDARESEPVKPVSEQVVQAVRPFVSRQVGAMIQLQMLTGMRPGEAVIMRATDLDMSGKMWSYTPSSHKTEHHGHQRTIYLGPRAQRILKPFLKRELSAFLFSPIEAEDERRKELTKKRVTPLSCGNRRGTNRKARSRLKPKERYTVSSYRRAIERGCDQAFPPPPALKEEEIRQWRRDHRWHPHQLRHTAATRLRKEFGIEAARVVLGHRSAAVTEVYAEIDSRKALETMSKVG